MFEPLFSIGVVVTMLWLLVRNSFEFVTIFLGATLVLVTANVITMREALVFCSLNTLPPNKFYSASVAMHK